MSQERNLAFLQNFYTDVTLYVPAEAATAAPATIMPGTAPTPVPSAPVPQQAAPLSATPPVAMPVPVAAAPAAVAAPVPAPAGAPAPVAAASVLPPAAPKLPSLASVPLPPPLTPTSPPPAAPVAPTAPPAAAVAPTPAPTPAVPPVMLTTFSTLGDQPQGLVLLFRLPPEQFKKLPRNVFLNKMLQALGLVMADVVLVNVESHLPVALANLRREITAGRILAFGKNLLDVAVRTTQIYEPVQFPSLALAYLAAAEVELLEYDTSLKKRLWAGLQRMFA